MDAENDGFTATAIPSFFALQENREIEMSDDDILYLANFLNPVYLVPKTLDDINKLFCKDSHVLLADILKPEIANRFKELVLEKDKTDLLGKGKISNHKSGEKNGWKCHGPPNLQRYLILQDCSFTPETLHKDMLLTCTLEHLFAIVNDMFQSLSFQKYLALLTNLGSEFAQLKTKVRRFRPGLDYTLALSNPQALLHVQLGLSPTHPAWNDGSVGGYSSYLLPPDPDQDAAVYTTHVPNHDDDGLLLTLPASFNTLSLVFRDKEVLEFVKYVSAASPFSRWDLDMEIYLES